jgi:hypothetical protein
VGRRLKKTQTTALTADAEMRRALLELLFLSSCEEVVWQVKGAPLDGIACIHTCIGKVQPNTDFLETSTPENQMIEIYRISDTVLLFR